MRRGAVLRLVLPAGGVAPRFFRASAFYAPPFCTSPLRVSSIRASALIVPLERMISHVFPWALT